MTRISTFSNYALTLANLAEAQSRQVDAGQRISSQKVAQDLKGYSGQAETLISMQSIKKRVDGLLRQNAVLQDRYTTQDIALNQLADASDGVRQAIAEALSSGRADTLMQELSGFFNSAQSALNMKAHGRFLFAGGQINTQPFTAIALTDLTAAAPSTYFTNDDFVISHQIDETTTLDAGFLADDLGLDLMNAFRDIQAFHEGASGPFTGELTEAQSSFLESVIGVFEQVHTDTINVAARNGAFLRRLEDTAADLQGRSDTMASLIGNVSEADVAKAVTDLEAAQFAVQASAQVFNTLRQSSLLNYLKF